MNEASEAYPNMTPVHKETEDEVMMETTAMPESMGTMRTYTHLAEKLKKLMTMDTANETTTAKTIDIDMDEQMKCAQVAKLQADCTNTPISINKTPSPEVKNSRMTRHPCHMPK